MLNMTDYHGFSTMNRNKKRKQNHSTDS